MSAYRTDYQSLGNGFHKVADFDFTVANYFLIPTDGRTVGSIHLRFSTARSTAVATLIVSNDLNRSEYADHPAAITLGSSTVSAPFDASYGAVGLRVSTAESNVRAEVYVRFTP